MLHYGTDFNDIILFFDMLNQTTDFRVKKVLLQLSLQSFNQ